AAALSGDRQKCAQAGEKVRTRSTLSIHSAVGVNFCPTTTTEGTCHGHHPHAEEDDGRGTTGEQSGGLRVRAHRSRRSRGRYFRASPLVPRATNRSTHRSGPG